jgi:HK97 family phage major capsid protein
MTRADLGKYIKEVVAPLIRDAVGPQLAELVRESVNQSLKAARPEGYAGPLFREEAPVSRTARTPGLMMARGLRAVAAAKLLGGGPERAIDILKGWGDAELAKAWEGAREKALSTGDPTAGGFLVPTQFSTDIIELLRPSAVVRSLDPSIMPMPMGSIKIPKITTGATAAYIGENANVTKSEEKTGQLTLSFKKLAALVPLSNDLVRYSSPSADSIVRDDMVRALATREDKAFLRDDGTSGTPKGIKNWVHAVNKFRANGTVSLANVTTDLGKAIQKLMAADVPIMVQQFPAGGPNQVQPITARPGWVFSPRTYMYLTTVQNGQGFYAFRPEMMMGTLWGFPYRVTSQVLETQGADGLEDGSSNKTEVYFGAFAHAVIGEALGMIVDASTEGAYYDGTSVQATFSLDQTVVRVIEEHDFALRYDKAFALIQSVTWGV